MLKIVFMFVCVYNFNLLQHICILLIIINFDDMYFIFY